MIVTRVFRGGLTLDITHKEVQVLEEALAIYISRDVKKRLPDAFTAGCLSSELSEARVRSGRSSEPVDSAARVAAAPSRPTLEVRQ